MSRTFIAAVAGALLVLAPSASPAGSSSVVIGEVFAGGGNAGAPYTNDYVELFNRGSAPVDIGGWTVQYASSASTSWSATALTGTIPAGGRYLVVLASGGTVGVAPPAADAAGTTNLAAAGGKIALVNQTAPLTCGSCTSQSSVQDLVGYGTATDYEGSAAAPALSATTAAVRAAGGCTDTNDNAADFTTAAPTPQNSAVAIASCAAATPSASVGVGLDVQPVLALTLDRASVSFGNVLPGDTPGAVTVTATVISNGSAGYVVSVHRSLFTPTDLPLAIARSGSALVPIPVAPAADLGLVSTTAASGSGGDTYATNLGFAAPLPALAPTHYSATVTYTVIAR
jgi:Lamin Tail Domain